MPIGAFGCTHRSGLAGGIDHLACPKPQATGEKSSAAERGTVVPLRMGAASAPWRLRGHGDHQQWGRCARRCTRRNALGCGTWTVFVISRLHTSPPPSAAEQGQEDPEIGFGVPHGALHRPPALLARHIGPFKWGPQTHRCLPIPPPTTTLQKKKTPTLPFGLPWPHQGRSASMCQRHPMWTPIPPWACASAHLQAARVHEGSSIPPCHVGPTAWTQNVACKPPALVTTTSPTCTAPCSLTHASSSAAIA